MSVIITTYNRAELVSRAIESVLRQTHPHVDVIVVDDGSTDDTAQVLAKIVDPRVRVLRHPKNRGVAAAKNTGLEAMKGAYGTFLDSDDELFPDAVEKLMKILEQPGHPYPIAFGDCVDARTGARTGSGLERDTDVTYRDFLCGRVTGEFWGVTQASLLGSVRLDERIPGHEWIAWHGLFRDHLVRYIRRPLRKYHRDVAGRITRSAFDRTWAEKQALGYRLYLEKFGNDIGRFCPRRLARLHQTRSFWLALCGRRREAFGALKRAWHLAPNPISAALFLGLLAPECLLRMLAVWRKRGT